MDTLIGFLLFASVIGLIIGLIKPSIVRIKSRKMVAIIFGGGLIVLFILANVMPSSSPENQAQSNAPSAKTNNTPAVSQTAPKTDQQKLEDNIKGMVPQFYGMSYRDLSVDSADPDRPAGTKMIAVNINNTEFTERSQLLGTSGDLSSKIFQAVFSANIKAYDVFVSYYADITDRYGNPKNQVVLVYGIDKDTYDKINWGNFAQNNLCNFLRQESNLEGGTGSDACNELVNIQ